MISTDKLQAGLKQYFGYDAFRPHQEEVIRAVMQGRDTMVLMPTGGGKSICYQLPALLMEGMAIVVSPLIALMKDQVEALKANGLAAAYLNSSLSSEEQWAVANAARAGEIKLLYVSPEKLVTPRFLDFLLSVNVSLFAIDEAHCISAWGHDFRPEYAELATLKAHFPNLPIIALTATADKPTRQDIIQQLKLQEPALFITSFNRPNIELTVRPGQKRMERMADFIASKPNTSGIIYCLSRRSTEEVAEGLRVRGFNAAHYHAKLTAEERNKVQMQFLRDEVPIICATIAFGMGIDKPNVRWVIHYNLPKNLEGYYQEIGRAGRDGLPSQALLFYTFRDVMLLQKFVMESGQQELNMAKLQRMQEYAEARICRRKILLSYFGEHLADNCGHCDVCHSPPQTFDGTEMAQKVLSAIYRLNEETSIGMVVDVLRGSRRQDLLKKGYHQIKTYGVGADLSAETWQLYILQMLQQGLVEIAYDQHHALKLTNASRAVLFEGQRVHFARQDPIRKKEESAYQPRKTKKERLEEALFADLRELRLQLAREQNVPPHVILTDPTLKELAEKRPFTPSAFLQISGITERKQAAFGSAFTQCILQFIARKTAEGERVTHGTQLYSWQLYQSGKTVAEIANDRSLKPDTIYAHLAKAFSLGLPVSVNDFVSEKEQQEILFTIEKLGEEGIRAVYDAFNEVYPFGLLKLVATYHGKEFAYT